MDWQTKLTTLCVTDAVSTPENKALTKGQLNVAPAHKDPIQQSDNAIEKKSKLLEVLADACKSLPIKATAVNEALSAQDIEDWEDDSIDDKVLAAFADALVQRRTMAAGKRPAHYTKRANCKLCGSVWLWSAGEVLGCPWCWNRINDKPIPRPHNVRCGDCVHFKRISHPNLGHCAKGEPEAPVGLWDTDPRSCGKFLPNTTATDGDS